MKSQGIPFELNFSLDETINIKDMVDDYVNEGIDIHPKYTKDNKIEFEVSHNARHSKGVDTSVKSNPTSFSLNVPKIKTLPDVIQVWSIFQRTKLDVVAGSSDGNPLVYAFKKEKNYVFRSEYDKKTLQDLMNKILDKFAKQWFSSISGDVATVICPSGNTLNDHFAQAFKDVSEKNGFDVNLYDDFLTKATVEDVMQHVLDDPNSEVNHWLLSLDLRKAKDARARIDAYFNRMEKEHNGMFSYHFIEDPKIRNMISKSMSLSFRSHEDIDGKNVLLLDDTISRGKTLQEAYQLICSSYNPKTVTALTLFSQLKK